VNDRIYLTRKGEQTLNQQDCRLCTLGRSRPDFPGHCPVCQLHHPADFEHHGIDRRCLACRHVKPLSQYSGKSPSICRPCAEKRRREALERARWQHAEDGDMGHFFDRFKP
jgi:hypothetical protein